MNKVGRAEYLILVGQKTPFGTRMAGFIVQCYQIVNFMLLKLTFGAKTGNDNADNVWPDLSGGRTDQVEQGFCRREKRHRAHWRNLIPDCRSDTVQN